jgi:hypothetical protein
MSQGGGIKKLAEAEELANRQIAQAKDRRAQRIQEAKNSAAKELAELRAKYQREFEQAEAQVRDSWWLPAVCLLACLRRLCQGKFLSGQRETAGWASRAPCSRCVV